MTDTALLQKLSDLVGLQTQYQDAWGHPYRTSEGAQVALLRAMGFPADNDELAQQSIERAGQQLFGAPIPPVVVAQERDGTCHVPLSVPAGTMGRITWIITAESQRRLRGMVELDSLPMGGTVAAGTQCYDRRTLTLVHPLPLGYHRLTIRIQGGRKTLRGEALIVSAPARCYRPPAIDDSGRRWGIATQLYNVRSARNWGIGDFTDLITMLRGASRLGASCVGVNPLHALFPEHPDHASPYSPSSRLFLNVLYLDVEAIADYADCDPARRMVGSRAFQERLQALREAALVDYRGVAACKLPVLEILYRSFRERCLHDPDNECARAFRRFQEEGGRALRRFAIYQALSEKAEEGFGWKSWPANFHDPDSPAVVAFAHERTERIEFHEYLQWQAEMQLSEANRTAERLRLGIGIYQDLAVGANDGGAESWDCAKCVAHGASAGAPPDAWNLKGQNWGLPPPLPLALTQNRYEPFIELVRANMRHGGAIRIDHIIGLVRLYWIPAGFAPTDGAYVAYPWRDLLAILALESHRCRCLVVGEDLGNVPPGLREAMAEAGILSYRLFYFERESDGTLRKAVNYPVEALVAIGTHDLPTFPAYWRSWDLETRDRLDLWPTPRHRADEVEARGRDRRRMIELLAPPSAGGPIPADPPVKAAYRFLASTPSRLLMVQLEDVTGQLDQINIPGTVEQYPNWRNRLNVPIERILECAELRNLAAALNEERDDRAFSPENVAQQSYVRPAIPTATYRLQFNSGFTFDDAARTASYLRALGVSHLYASPWLKARRGSVHGYDITDHNAFNPELGGAHGFRHLAAILEDYRLGHVLDFVPNHMGIGRADNAWWLDVLEWGPESPYADYFDIDWNANSRLKGKVLLPFLGDQYGRELEAGRLVPRFDPATGTCSVWYFDHRFPIAVSNYGALLRRTIAETEKAGSEGQGAHVGFLNGIADSFDSLASLEPSTRRSRAVALKAKLAEFTVDDREAGELIAGSMTTFYGTPGEPETFLPLHRLLEEQHYRLADWNVSSDEINYRRFFNINDLAGIRIENPTLFEAAHRLVARLVAEDKLHGLRIDHIDGLFDPAGYCANLRKLVGDIKGDEPFTIVVEKIQARHERLREDWPVQGTTGYDFLAQVNGLFVDMRSEAAMTRAYERFVGREEEFDLLLHEAKLFVMGNVLGGELSMLAKALDELSERHWSTRDFTLEGLRAGLKEVVACFPVYRTYVTAQGATALDRRDIAWATSQARKRWRGPGKEIIDFIESALTADLGKAFLPDRRTREEAVRFAMRIQQFTGPVMAKSLEDTAFYRYHRLRSLNEVGSDPRTFGLSLSAFHHLNQDRLAHWPQSMLATASHDTKLGEDVRARINVLSEIPVQWGQRAGRWASLNRRRKQDVDARLAPSRNDEYLFYQTLLGAWPIGLRPDDAPDAAYGTFIDRMKAYMLKAIREAKVHTSWSNPNAAYEGALDHFISQVLDPRLGRPFLRDFLPFQERIAVFGMLNSLSQTTLKMTCPGIPDIYQGSELWDLHLVDPDNRRAVDFDRRERTLAEIRAANRTDERVPFLERLRGNWHDGRIKQSLTFTLLRLRQQFPALFLRGSYQPLQAEGPLADRICAFQRKEGPNTLMVAVGRFFAGAGIPTLAPGDHTGPHWNGTELRLPGDVPWPLTDVLTARCIEGPRDTVALSELFAVLPVCVLTAATPPVA